MSEQESTPAAGPPETPEPSSQSKSAPARAGGKGASKKNAPGKPKEAARNAPEGAAAGSASKPAPPRRGRGGLWLALLALVVAILAALGAGYLWTQQQQLRDALQHQRSTLDDTASTLRSDLSGDWTRRAERLEARDDELDQGQQSLRESVESVRELAGRSRRDWILAEVEYLLRIANRRLQLQRDAVTAMAALQNADARLRELADPGLTEVREGIARELDALRGTPRPDLEGLAAQLGSLSEQVAQLPVKAARAPERTPTGAPDAPARLSAQQWRQGLQRAWEALKSLVVVRRRDEHVAPLLGTAQEFAVREGLRLQLEAARVALLRQDPQLFATSVQGAQDWLARYFVADDARYDAVAQALQRLRSSEIRSDLPDISASLRLLRDVMHQRGLDTEMVPADQPSPTPGADQPPAAQESEASPQTDSPPQPSPAPPADQAQQAPASDADPDAPSPSQSQGEQASPAAPAEQPEAAQ